MFDSVIHFVYYVSRMTRLGKLAKKFQEHPEKVSYSDIERLLLSAGFEKVQAKGSHIKFKHYSV